MHLVDVSHGAVFLGEIANCADRRDVGIHRIDALEQDQLRPLRSGFDQQLFEMREIVVAEDFLLAAGLAHALDHRIVVVGIRQDQDVRNQFGEGRDAGLVGDVTRGKDQCGFLAVQVGEFGLELDQRVIGAGDVAGAAGAGAHAGRGLDHGADDLRMLAHAEIVVGTPDDDFARAFRGMPDGLREPAGDPLQIREHAIAPLVMQTVQGGIEKGLVVHGFRESCRGPSRVRRVGRHGRSTRYWF